MNIWEAKEEIKRTVLAYTARTKTGALRIPIKSQRPVLLMGPPGIGKTAVVEQAAGELALGFVAYTMTHHTRQSAIGLPLLEKRKFQGEEYTVTAYTMSEILASVYEQMEQTGRKEGILFLDEINCVSETLMPSMLQFLQYKTFGSHRLPEGWILVAAGNPARYNSLVREFDMAVLDRVKRMDVEPDLEVWKRYALARGVHPAILSFLELRTECFYMAGGRGKGFVTGRGWEDLSRMLLALETLEQPVEEVVFGEYLQEEETARQFAFYYRIYEKWNRRFCLLEILEGDRTGEERGFSDLPFDERLCIIWLLLQKLCGMAVSWEEQEKLSRSLEYFAAGAAPKPDSGDSWEKLCRERLESRKRGLEVRRQYGLLEQGEEERERQLAELVLGSLEKIRLSGDTGVFTHMVQDQCREEKEREKSLVKAMEKGIAFVRRAFGEGQELAVFLTNLTEHPAASRMLKEHLPEEFQEASAFLCTGRKEEALRKRILGEIGERSV